MQPWIIKHLPKTGSDIIGQKEAVFKLRSFLASYKSQKKKAILIWGPPGTGKTSSVYALGRELDLEVIEVNASDFRNKEKINAVVGTASRQMSLFAKGKIVLVDEIDGLSGSKDRGGLQEIQKIIEQTPQPIVLTAENPYDQKFSKIRSRSEVIAFESLNYSDIFEKLKQIAGREGLDYGETALRSLARRAGGDMRAAINDLQSMSHLGKLEAADLEMLGDREQKETIIEALLKILKTRDPQIALSALDNVNEDYDQVMLWLDENIPAEYKKPADLARAYDKLSKADVYKRRIRRWQHWRFLVYIQALITAGIAVSKDEKYKGFASFKPSGRILKIWMANQKNAKKKAIAEKLGCLTHTSSKKAYHDIAYLQHMLKGKKFRESLALELDLTSDEKAFFGI